MSFLLNVFLLFVLTFILIKSTDWVVHSLRSLGRETHTKVFVLSTIILAIATSFPELFVGVTSAIAKSPHLSLGNVLGANIANISLVAGLSAIIVGGVKIHSEFVRHEVWIALIAGILPLLLILDGILSRGDGIFLLILYLVYVLSFFKDRFLVISHQDRSEGYIHRFLRNFSHPTVNKMEIKDAFKLLLGVISLLLSAHFVVKIAVSLAASINIPIFLVGLFILSLGTTLPELAFSVKSLKDRHPTMFYGNLLGSIIANSTLILGLAAFIYPIEILNVKSSLIAGISFVVIFTIFWLLIRKRLSISRWQGVLLLLLYFLFVFIEIV